jgi:hypothetical protein
VSRHETQCQCKYLGPRCDSEMTAEDLLCDQCREGCSLVFMSAQQQIDDVGTHLCGKVNYGPMHWPESVLPVAGYWPDGGTRI